MDDRLTMLLNRLWRVCESKPEFGGDLWGRGLQVLERKFGMKVWLSAFEPLGMSEGEVSASDVTVAVADSDSV